MLKSKIFKTDWSAKIKTIEYLTRLKGIDEKKWEEEKDE